MTEIMERFENPKMESVYPIPGARYAIDPIAFFFALICAPLVIALMFFWVIGIPVFALFFGGVPYLVFGTPVLLIYLHYRQGSPEGAAACAAITVIVGCVIHGASELLMGRVHMFEFVWVFGVFGVIHAFAWGIAFGKLYNRWRSDLSRQPLPPFPTKTLKGPIPC